jgi:cytochrome c oxidase subunit III
VALAPDVLEKESARAGGPDRPAPPLRGDFGGRSGGGIAADPARFGLWLFLGTVTMLFIGFTSAYMVRRGAGDWRPLAAPALLFWNTAAIAASSVALEVGRRRLRGWAPAGAIPWVTATGILGVLFAAGQVAAWRVLAARGFYLDSNPHNSFFYVLTGVHLVHLAGGLVWCGVVLSRVRRLAYVPGEDGLGLFATYWHFLAGLWLYLLLLLFVF